jgi:hypothetical protein
LFLVTFLTAFLTASFIALILGLTSLSESELVSVSVSSILTSRLSGVTLLSRGAYRLALILLGLGDPVNLVALIFVRVFKVLRSKDLD